MSEIFHVSAAGVNFHPMVAVDCVISAGFVPLDLKSEFLQASFLPHLKKVVCQQYKYSQRIHIIYSSFHRDPSTLLSTRLPTASCAMHTPFKAHSAQETPQPHTTISLCACKNRCADSHIDLQALLTPLGVEKQDPGRQVFLEQAHVAGTSFLLICHCLIVIMNQDLERVQIPCQEWLMVIIRGSVEIRTVYVGNQQARVGMSKFITSDQSIHDRLQRWCHASAVPALARGFTHAASTTRVTWQLSSRLSRFGVDDVNSNQT